MITLLRRNPDTTNLVLMLALTFSTGMVDAIGYLGLDRVFSGNMTGNVVILGMALTGAGGLPVVGPVIALVSFMAGAAIGGRLLRRVGAGWAGRSTVVYGVVAGLLVVICVLLLTVPGSVKPVMLVVTALLSLAMGAQAGAARHLGVKDVTTVVVTSTLTGLAADSVLGARKDGHPWRRRAAAIILIGAGAAAGALALQVGLALGVGIAAGITAIVALLGHLARPKPSAPSTEEEAGITPAVKRR